MVFHVLIVFALVFGWSQVSAAEVSPVEISIPAMLNVAENDSNVRVCATLSLRTGVHILTSIWHLTVMTQVCVYNS